MAILSVTAANVSANQNQGSIIRSYQAGGTVNVGDVVYADTSNLVYQSIGNSTQAVSQAIGIVVDTQDLYGSTSAAANKWVSVCVYGPVDGFSSLTPGAPAWVDKTTAGKMNSVAPTGGAWQYIIGHAIDTVTFFVDPGGNAAVSS